jgi:hypothetical protein
LRLRAFTIDSRPEVVLQFDLAERTSVIAQVYDVSGRRIGLAGTGTFEPGEVELRWQGRTLGGELAASGVYFVRVTTSEGESATAKVMLRR